jgi:hypothetical protein
MSGLIRNLGLCVAVCLPAAADFSYTQTSRMTGGSLYNMMKRIPGGGKTLEPQTSTVMLKGNRMATVHADRITVIDLDKETNTEINLKDKTYSVITFAELRQLMQAVGQQATQSGAGEMQMNFEVKETGQTRTIQGLATNEYLMKITMEVTDPKTQQKGEMVINTDAWHANDIPGYQEVRAFHLRMAEKLGASPDTLRMNQGMMQPGMGQGLARMAKEGAKLKGVPVLQVTKMMGAGGMYAGMQAPPDAQGGGQQQSGPGASAVGDAAQRQAANTARNEAAYDAARASGGGRLGGLAGAATGTAIGGMLGGFGRKKPQSQPQQEQAPPPQQQAPPPQAAAPAQDALLETTMEYSNFSGGGVDSSKFDVPSGFRLVESDMKKNLERMQRR